MLCDVTKVHTGIGIMPKVTHVSDDVHWGVPGSSKKIYVADSLTQKGGYGSRDHIIERVDNQYWVIQVDDFQSWMLGFYKFVGEWKTTPLEGEEVLVEYTYFLYSDNPVFYPLNWLFAKTFWRIYMRRVLENVRELAYTEAPYQYE